MEQILNDIRALMSLKDDMAEIKKIVAESNEKLGPINHRLEKLETENEKISQEVDQLREENWELRQRLDHLEQYSRKTNMIIYGIPRQEGERLNDVIQKLASKLQVPYSKADIAACHRLPSKKGSVQPIIVRFINYETKEVWIRASKREKLSSEALNIAPPDSHFLR